MKGQVLESQLVRHAGMGSEVRNHIGVHVMLAVLDAKGALSPTRR